MRVTEIFYSVQGESSFAGLPCIFIRLTGCPLRCSWCDTEYAFDGGTDMTIDAILEDVRRRECTLVEITGGEPLQQPAVVPLLAALCDRGYTVLLETSGALDVS